MSEMKMILERWGGFLNEQDASAITTIGELHDYFEKKDPGTLKKLAVKYGGITAKVLGMSVGAIAGVPMAGAAGAAAGAIAEKVAEQLLMASIMAFANIEDGSYPEGSAASYFDLDDHLTLFLRDVETQGKELAKPSLPEQEVFTIMKKKIEDAIQGNVEPATTIADLLQSITSQSIMDARIQSGEHSGKVKVEPI